MGCQQLQHLNHGKYTSQRTIQEFLQVIGEQIEHGLLNSVHTSPMYSIMIDKTTDVSILKEMVVYVMYLTPEAKVCTGFLTINELPDGTVETVEKILQLILRVKICHCLEWSDLAPMVLQS